MSAAPTTTVSFPGLGIDEFSFSRVAFSIGSKAVYWYGILILCGMIAAFAHAYVRSKREKIREDDLLDLTIFIILFGVLGARLYYVATTWGTGRYKTFLDVIAIWEGGLAIYGGVIAGIITAVIVCRVKKLNPLRVLDMAAPGVMLAQAIGRWGNFMNGEAFGEVIPEGSLLYPFRMGLLSEFTGPVMQYYHPTFLYESLWNVIGFILITLTYKHKKFNGQIVLSYLTWYGFGRMFIEGLRTDSLYVGTFRISQVVGLLCFVIGAGLLTAGFILSAKGKLPASWFGVIWASGAAGEAAAEAAAEGESEAATDETAGGESAENAAEEEANEAAEAEETSDVEADTEDKQDETAPEAGESADGGAETETEGK